MNVQLSNVWDTYFPSYKLNENTLTYGSLRNKEYEYFNVQLNRDYYYAFTTVCDGDCGDIDLYLYD